MSAMSKDRVRFTFTDADSNKSACIQAAVKAFGMRMSQAYEAFNTAATIICRPSQFARFLIYRSQNVTCNRFQQFEAELVTPKLDTIVDVSTNPAG